MAFLKSRGMPTNSKRQKSVVTTVFETFSNATEIWKYAFFRSRVMKILLSSNLTGLQYWGVGIDPTP